MRKAAIWAGAALLIVVSVVTLIATTGRSYAPTASGPVTAVRGSLPGVTSRDWQVGSDVAPVTITVYTDFECPVCAQYELVLEEVLRVYPTKVRCVFRNYPLTDHPLARIAAQAAYAAQQQGRFVDMNSLLYANQSDWASSDNPAPMFVEYAQKLGLDVGVFKQDMDSKTAKSFVEEQFRQATELGLGGTPSFFFNGNYLELKYVPPNIDAFKRIVDYVLAKSSDALVQ